jgi:Flp pilus assembly protein TadG
MKKRKSSEAGQAVILMVVLSMTVLLGFVGLAADVGLLFRQERILQTAVDSAAIAGSAENGGGYADVAAAAENDAATNGVGGCTQNVNTATVPAPVSPATCSIVVNNPPLIGPHKNDSNYVEVMATQNQPTIFMSLFSWAIMPISARAVAYPGNGANAGCVYTLETSGDGISMSGNGALSVPSCSIYVDSNIHMNGATSIDAGAVGVVGTASGTITPTPVNIPVVPDPLAHLPAPTVSGSCVSPAPPLIPGTYYCGLNGTYQFTASGLYIVGSGGVSGNISASPGVHVTLYVTNGGGVRLMGTNSLVLSAETCKTTTYVCSDGTYNEVVYFQDRTDNTQFLYNDTAATLNLSGIMYMPDAELYFKGSPSAPLDVSVVCNDLLMNGGPTFSGPPITGGVFPIKVSTLAE